MEDRAEKKRIKIRVNIKNDCKKRVLLDGQRMQQILFNLLGFAIQTSKERSKILVNANMHQTSLLEKNG